MYAYHESGLLMTVTVTVLAECALQHDLSSLASPSILLLIRAQRDRRIRLRIRHRRHRALAEATVVAKDQLGGIGVRASALAWTRGLGVLLALDPDQVLPLFLGKG